MIGQSAYVEARLGRWTVWYRWGTRPGPRPVISWYGPMVLDPNVQQPDRRITVCPVDISEAEQTDAAVRALDPVYLRETIFQVYLRGGTIEQKCGALGLRSRQALYNRLDSAYIKLLGYFNDQAADIPLPRPIMPAISASLKIA